MIHFERFYLPKVFHLFISVLNQKDQWTMKPDERFTEWLFHFFKPIKILKCMNNIFKNSVSDHSLSAVWLFKKQRSIHRQSADNHLWFVGSISLRNNKSTWRRHSTTYRPTITKILDYKLVLASHNEIVNLLVCWWKVFGKITIFMMKWVKVQTTMRSL